MKQAKYPRRKDNSGPYPLRYEVLRIIQHAEKILKEFKYRQSDQAKAKKPKRKP